jgi:hypothetical protein
MDLVVSGTRLKDGNGRFSTGDSWPPGSCMETTATSYPLDGKAGTIISDHRFFNSLPTVAVCADEMIEFDDAVP